MAKNQTQDRTNAKFCGRPNKEADTCSFWVGISLNVRAPFARRHVN
jgi:prenyltransferase beta subunit